MEKLRPKAVALSLAVVTAISYVSCAVFVTVTRDAAMKFFGFMFHGIDLTKVPAVEMSFSNAAVGFVETVVFALIAGWLFAVIYNKIR